MLLFFFFCRGQDCVTVTKLSSPLCQVFVPGDLINEDKVCEDADRLYTASVFSSKSKLLVFSSAAGEVG